MESKEIKNQYSKILQWAVESSLKTINCPRVEPYSDRSHFQDEIQKLKHS